MTAPQQSDKAPRGLSRSMIAHLLMFATVMVWGATFVIVKQALATVPPQWFNAARMMVAFCCVAVFYRKQWRGITRGALLAGLAAGAGMAAGYFFQTQGLLDTSATNSAFLTALVVVVVPFLASVPGLRAPNAQLPGIPAWTGALLAFLGVALLTTPAHTPWPRLVQTLNCGDILSIACAVGFSLQILALDRGSKHVEFRQLTLLQVGFSMLFLTIGAGLAEPHAAAHLFSAASPLLQPRTLLAIATAGILATAVAFSVQTWAQRTIPATNIAIVLTLEPVFAWLTAFLVLHERLKPRSALGALLVLAGILTAELLPRWRQRLAAVADDGR